MNDFLKNLKENKIAVALFIVGLIIGGAIYLTQQKKEVVPQKVLNLQQEEKGECQISFTQAPDFVGKNCKVKGKIDHVYVSKKGNIFLNFCKDYKTCPFYAMIFKEDASKFEPENLEGKIVQIKGIIKTYKGRAEIVINDPSQIEVK